MFALLVTPALHLAIITAMVAILCKFKLVTLNPRWIRVSLSIFASYWLIKITGIEVTLVKALMPTLNWPWDAKLSLLLCSLLWLVGLMVFRPGFKASHAGFTFKQNPGSIKAMLIATGLLLVFRYYLTLVLGQSDGSRDPEELLFLATMHAIDKEPLYRGILLYTLSLAIISHKYVIFNARINIAGILLVLLFALAHGFSYNNGQWFFFPVGLFITSLHGFVYLWMRQRTGSLVFPIIAHNAVLILNQVL
ncbi:MAG: CPBP family intramembrane metalloprotease [Algicola sp.]|nr:CPBP family intramembrane metalloprotease [Algicola sp.]